MALNLSRLNSRQREAVLHGEGPLLILAGAGSGKTSTMAYRISHLISERKISPKNILGLSFTNKAATELKERVSTLVPKSLGLTVCTFHSLCVRILKAHGHHLGYQKNFTIVDQNDQREILKQTFKNVKIDDRKFDLDRILFEIGQAKSRFLSAEQTESYFLESGRLHGDYSIAAVEGYRHYQNQLRILNSMDFDDLLFNAVHLLEKFPEVTRFYNHQFRYILVDEYQDTNGAQFKLLRLLTQKSQNLCVVGDDDQSIYAWRGADPTHILEFTNHFPDSKTILLNQNYRSTTSILDAANCVISNNKKRHKKDLWSEKGQGEPPVEMIFEEDHAEAEFVADEISTLTKAENRPWKDFAVLYRSNAQSRVFEEALRRHRIPYEIVGTLSFLERKEVRDILSLWRIIANPKDDASLRRVVSWLGLGLGKISLDKLGKKSFELERSLFDLLSTPENFSDELNPKALKSATALYSAILEWQTGVNASQPDSAAVVAALRRIHERIDLKATMEKEADDPAQFARKWENVEELLHSLGQTKVEGSENGLDLLKEFLHRLALNASEEAAQPEREDSSDLKNAVTLLTLHGAKGLEYSIVFLVGMEEGFLPHKRTLEEGTDLSEERRLCYVGITRAKDRLIMTRAKNRIRFGKKVPRYRSRFLDEIPTNHLRIQDSSLVPEPTSEQARLEHEAKVKNFLADIRGKLMNAKPV